LKVSNAPDCSHPIRGFERQRCSVSRRSLPLGLLTLTAIEKSFGAVTVAGANVGNARYSGPWTSVKRVSHSYDCFLAARTHHPDPLLTFDALTRSAQSSWSCGTPDVQLRGRHVLRKHLGRALTP